MSAKKKSKAKKTIKKLMPVICAVIITLVVVFIGSKVIFKCDNCGKTSFGSGYEPNILTGSLSDEERICKECAEKEHSFSSAFGGDIDEFKLPIKWF
ncbi:MAG: hypothetical protein II702_06875 [Clostridia bacterium]|nr:hypothetical protein [Clostridia bacterium]